MGDFIGCIILESLADQSVMQGVVIEAAKDCPAPAGDRFSVWHQRLIRGGEGQADSFAGMLARATTEDYYAHYFNESKLYVVFRNRFFVLPKVKDSSWDEMIDFGKTVGVGAEYTGSIPVVRERLLG